MRKMTGILDYNDITLPLSVKAELITLAQSHRYIYEGDRNYIYLPKVALDEGEFPLLRQAYEGETRCLLILPPLAAVS